ncbi:MAG: DUF5011 domain-containing protein [Clostridia bacterium]|nr:DUF5011 domain-containing protein [Clostridia bacterium]
MKKRTQNKMKNTIKKTSTFTKVLCVFLFVICCCGGAYATYSITKNDTFELIGESLIELSIGEEYIEQGVKAIAFGKDISSQVIRTGTVDKQTKGEYILKYTVNNFRFKGYTLYKKVVVSE